MERQLPDALKDLSIELVKVIEKANDDISKLKQSGKNTDK